jgi:N6-adenosine-specific RNA methylase IME4
MKSNHISLIEIDKIIIGENREIDTQNVDRIARSIRLTQLLQPIAVIANNDGTFKLVDGQHRIEAYKELGRTQIEAFSFETDDPELAKLLANSIRCQINLAFKVAKIKEFNTKYLQLIETKQDNTTPRAGGPLRALEEIAKSKPDKKSFMEHLGVELNLFNSHEACRQAIRVVENCRDEVIQNIDKGSLSINKAYIDLVQKKVGREKQLRYLNSLLESPDAELDKTTLRASEDARRAEKRKVKSKPSKVTVQKAGDAFTIIYASPVIDKIPFIRPDVKAWHNRIVDTWKHGPMKIEDIASMNINAIINDGKCMLFLVIPSTLIHDGLYIMRKWGFTYLNYYSIAEAQQVLTIIKDSTLFQYPHGTVLIGYRKHFEEFKFEKSERPIVHIEDGLADGVLDMIDNLFPTEHKVKLFDDRPRKNWELRHPIK